MLPTLFLWRRHRGSADKFMACEQPGMIGNQGGSRLCLPIDDADQIARYPQQCLGVHAEG